MCIEVPIQRSHPIFVYCDGCRTHWQITFTQVSGSDQPSHVSRMGPDAFIGRSGFLVRALNPFWEMTFLVGPITSVLTLSRMRVRDARWGRATWVPATIRGARSSHGIGMSLNRIAELDLGEAVGRVAALAASAYQARSLCGESPLRFEHREPDIQPSTG